MSKIKLIIAGSRDITEYEVVAQAIRLHGLEGSIGSIATFGLDMCVQKWCRRNKVSYRPFPSQATPGHAILHYWGHPEEAIELIAKYGEMLLAIWDGKSKGTKMMIDYMKKLGKAVIVFNVNP